MQTDYLYDTIVISDVARDDSIYECIHYKIVYHRTKMRRKDYLTIINTLKESQGDFIKLYPDTPSDVLKELSKYHKSLIDTLLRNLKKDNLDFRQDKFDEALNK